MPNSAFCYPYTINDHEKLDQTGYISVIGGDLCLHRLIAEKVSNLACQKIKNSAPCLTKETPLVSSGIQLHAFPNKAMFQDFSAHPLARDYLTHAFCQELIVMCKKCLNSTTNREKSPILCDCEAISEEMLHWAAKNLFVTQIDDYRRRTRQGMGICQGQFCFMKIANFETKISNKTHAKIIEELKHSLEKRWKTERLGDVYLKRQIKLAKYMYILGGNLQ